MHTDDSLVPSSDYTPLAERKAEGVAAVPAGVEFGAVFEHANVVHDEKVAGLGFVAVAIDEVGDSERERGVAFGGDGFGLAAVDLLC